MLVSSSEGFWRDGLLGAILFKEALMIAAFVVLKKEKSQKSG